MRGTQLKLAERDNLEGTPANATGGVSRRIDAVSLLGAAFIVCALIYAGMFVRTASGPWFNPRLTNDDAQQQLYPLYRAIDPELFNNDLVTKCMEGYLAPLHYAISYSITLLTADPVMTGHWVMFIQFCLGLLFIFGTVRAYAGYYPAVFSGLWYLHARPLWSRMVGGLPRGWLGPLLLCYLYCVATKRYGAVLLLVVVASLLNPPAAFLICTAHALYLGWQWLANSDRAIWFKRGIAFFVVAAISGAVTLQIVRRPPEIGQMVTLEQARKMPAFNIRGGRFAFLPFPSSLEQLSGGGSRAFFQNSRFVPESIKPGLFPLTATVVAVFAVMGWRRRINAVPSALIASLIAVVGTYFLARQFAFKLYVPNRYILVPLNLMWMVIFPIAIWKLSERYESRKPTVNRFASLFLLGLLLLGVNGFAVRSAPGFDISTETRSGVYRWMETNSAKDAVFAGHPDSLNGVPLFGKRIVYVNSEVAHPFYITYYEEMKRRLNISLRLSYARSWQTFMNVLKDEKIDYFIFTARDYDEKRLNQAKYVQPFSRMVKRLARNRPREQFLFSKLPRQVDPERFPYVVFADSDSAVIDLRKLRARGLPSVVL